MDFYFLGQSRAVETTGYKIGLVAKLLESLLGPRSHASQFYRGGQPGIEQGKEESDRIAAGKQDPVDVGQFGGNQLNRRPILHSSEFDQWNQNGFGPMVTQQVLDLSRLRSRTSHHDSFAFE